MSKPNYKDEEWMEEQYKEKELSGLEIAKECSVDPNLIYYWLERFNIERRSRWGKHIDKVCEQCGESFESGYEDRRFCSQECYSEWKKEGYKHTCKQCGETFRVFPSQDRKFCSRECYSEWRRKEDKNEQVCERCGETFYAQKDRKYCSRECYKDSKTEITCEQCGEDFKVFRKSADERRFCSQECFGKWQSKKQESEKIKLTCEQCGKTFEAVPSEKDRKFCSQECYHKSQRADRIELTCKQCGKAFKVTPSRKNQEFCSQECRNKWGTNCTSSQNRLDRNMGRSMRRALKDDKSGRYWESLVPYNLKELKDHLEEQFEEGMTWENHALYGWHIDHITPKYYFDYSSPEDEEFQECWALDNLQPLWSEENIAKGANLDWEK